MGWFYNDFNELQSFDARPSIKVSSSNALRQPTAAAEIANS